MEMEQIIKRVDWLDDERRKDKNSIASFEERLIALEGNLPALTKQIKELTGEITRMNAALGQMDSFDESLLEHRVEMKKNLDDMEKQLKKRNDDAEKVYRVELRAMDANLVEIRKELSMIPDIKRSLQARVDEEARVIKSVDEVRARVETLRHSEEEYTRAYRLLEDGRRQDGKRLTDIQGEVAALRKHLDDQRGKMEVTGASLRKIETRLSELSMLEAERREAQEKFLEDQALVKVERERQWKEWQARFDTIEKQTTDVEANLQALESTHRAVKRSQQSLDELNVKVDRRINEMAEIQRLAEERFRQEWVTFRADDQKRWTNYTLTQEEQRGEITRQFDKLSDRVTGLEDTIQEVQDLLQQMNEQTERRLQSLLAAVHDWVSAYERSIGRIR